MRLTYTRGPPQGRMLSCCQMPQPASDDLAKGAPMSPEVELIRALSEDLALEILASYAPDDFADADFTSLGTAAVYLADHGSAPRARARRANHENSERGGGYRNVRPRLTKSAVDLILL